MSRPVRNQQASRVLAGVVAVLATLTMLVGCSRSVDGTAVKAGAGDVPRNNNSEKQYPNLLKECDVLTQDVLAKTVGADPLDIQSTFVGAVCRWQAANPAGLIDHVTAVLALPRTVAVNCACCPSPRLTKVWSIATVVVPRMSMLSNTTL